MGAEAAGVPYAYGFRGVGMSAAGVGARYPGVGASSAAGVAAAFGFHPEEPDAPGVGAEFP